MAMCVADVVVDPLAKSDNKPNNDFNSNLLDIVADRYAHVKVKIEEEQYPSIIWDDPHTVDTGHQTAHEATMDTSIDPSVRPDDDPNKKRSSISA
jgi:hypothetical protein